MKIEISAGAEADVADGYWFYERQSSGSETTFVVVSSLTLSH